jgi:hypothetical protein
MNIELHNDLQQQHQEQQHHRHRPQLSYEYPSQFNSANELLQFLYQDEGVCPSLITSLIASNQVELLTDLVCIILSRMDTTYPQSTTDNTQPLQTTTIINL